VFGPGGDLYVTNANPLGAGEGVLRFNGVTGAFIDFAALPVGSEPNELVFQSVIPEPSGLAVLWLGFAAMGARRRPGAERARRGA
jgi:hypothetical protein